MPDWAVLKYQSRFIHHGPPSQPRRGYPFCRWQPDQLVGRIGSLSRVWGCSCPNPLLPNTCASHGFFERRCDRQTSKQRIVKFFLFPSYVRNSKKTRIHLLLYDHTHYSIIGSSFSYSSHSHAVTSCQELVWTLARCKSIKFSARGKLF